MVQGSRTKALMVGVLAVCGAIAPATHILAQSNITPDDTLGAERSNVIQNFIGLPVEVITDGAQRGQNLFHSFREFNVSAGRGAYFFSPDAAIQNILARVTGTNRSDISGVLGTLGNSQPNLFLINPNGIVFGPGASLNVGGSFVATTANAIQFGDRGFFNASVPNIPSPLLTINPSAFLFNQITRGSIENRSIAPAGSHPAGFNLLGLRVPDGQSLLLVGGDVSINGGWVNAVGGRIELGGLAEAGTIQLKTDGNNLNLSFPEDVTRADVSLSNGAIAYVNSSSGGSIAINAKNLNLYQGSLILAGIEGGLGTPTSQAGDIVLNATDTTTINGSYIQNQVNSGATGNSGNLILTTANLNVLAAGELGTFTSGNGNAGQVTIQASNSVALDQSYIYSTVGENAIGSSGGVFISTGSLSATKGAQVYANMSGKKGNAGGVTIVARDFVSFDGQNGDFPSGIFSDVKTGAIGNSGDVNIQAGSVVISNGGYINANTFGQGNAGGISIQARDTVSLFGEGRSRIENNIGIGGVGDTGGIHISTGSLFLTDLAFMSSNVDGRGNAGGVTIIARDLVSLEQPGRLTLAGEPGTLILSRVNDGAIGNGGDINITTSSLRTSNAQLTTSTWGRGNSGSVIINARDSVTLLQSTDIFTEVTAGSETESGVGGIGNGGDIRITTDSLFLDGGSNLRADTEATGNAGNIIINAKDITFSGSSEEFTSGAFTQVEPEAVGQGGNIFITTSTLSLSGAQEINTRTQGQGDAGNIFIQADSITLDGSNVRVISAASRQGRLPGTSGNGGDITITTGSLSITNQAQLTASTQINGSAGNITVTANRLTLDNQGRISSDSVANIDGGNVILNIRDLLLLRRGSQISTNAGTEQAGGDGGNITINAPKGFIVGVKNENSDITANAFTGSGGRIDITAQGIYGLQFRPRLTPFSDITASSEFGISGVVTLNTPNVDPNRGLVQLPVNPVDPSQQIDQSCVPGSRQSRGRFVVTGRGGVPESPTEPLQDQTVITEWVNLRTEDGGMRTEERGDGGNGRSPLPSNQIVEATGWIRDTDGTIVLVAEMPAVEPRSFWHALPPCPSP